MRRSLGVLLTGLSAGSICWFEEGITDPLNAPLYKLEGLGMLRGSHCPHYDGESKRRPSYHNLVLNGEAQSGYAADDGAALHFIDEQLHKIVSSRVDAHAYHVQGVGNTVTETQLAAGFLG
ncbi:Type 1 glutamine amidotransferase-like domain-containing protein [Paenibacillus glucanolyticus]|uniref:Type 1 glutamine amidotransferase-like domain-containing protein n=1 Tax=Paenibacillus glucanolyticus TaxID=59843 RepID=UPI00368E6835